MSNLLPLLLMGASVAAAQTVIPLWPVTATTPSQEIDTTKSGDDLIAGKRVERLTNVTTPTITVYRSSATKNSGTAVVVFPGGGYRILALDLEGTEVCDWLTSAGVTCVLLKYRVPDAGPYPEHSEDLADAQRAVRLTREHAADWKVSPDRVGVLGFSAGGHLAVALSNHFAEATYPAKDAADHLSAKPDFALLIYPGLLVRRPGNSQLRSEAVPNATTPPTFVLQAENDPVHVENALAYYNALKEANVPSELHIFAQGGHGYGLRPTALPITRWPHLATEWLHTIGMLPGAGADPANSTASHQSTGNQ